MGDVIRLHRERLGLSQEELGDRVGVSRQAVQQWEANRTGPQRKVVPRLAQALGITPAVLNPLLSDAVQLTPLPEERFSVPLYHLSDLALLTVDLAGNILWPAINTSLPVTEDLATTKAVTISDDLMSPEYLTGDVLLIDSTITPYAHDDIVIRIGNAAAIVRRYVERGRNKAGKLVFDLITPNAESATLTVTEGENYVILGVVVEARRRKRR